MFGPPVLHQHPGLEAYLRRAEEERAEWAKRHCLRSKFFSTIEPPLWLVEAAEGPERAAAEGEILRLFEARRSEAEASLRRRGREWPLCPEGGRIVVVWEPCADRDGRLAGWRGLLACTRCAPESAFPPPDAPMTAPRARHWREAWALNDAELAMAPDDFGV